jgi:hypothetical protein
MPVFPSQRVRSPQSAAVVKGTLLNSRMSRLFVTPREVLMLNRPPRPDRQREARFHIAHCPLRHHERAQRCPMGGPRQLGGTEARACSLIVRRRFAHHRSIAFSAARIASRLGPSTDPCRGLGDVCTIQIHWLLPTAILISYLTPRCSTNLVLPTARFHHVPRGSRKRGLVYCPNRRRSDWGISQRNGIRG